MSNDGASELDNDTPLPLANPLLGPAPKGDGAAAEDPRSWVSGSLENGEEEDMIEDEYYLKLKL